MNYAIQKSSRKWAYESFLSVILSLSERTLDFIIKAKWWLREALMPLPNTWSNLWRTQLDIFRFVNIFWYPNYLFSQRMKVKKNGSTNFRKKLNGNGPRNKSLPVFTWICQDANTIAMYGLSKSLTIKFLLVFNILKYSFPNITNFLLILWWLTGYECGCYLLDRRNVLWRERVSTRWNHEHHDETMSMEGTTIQR